MNKGPTPWRARSEWHAIGERIADACQGKSIRFIDLAQQLGVSPALLSKWMKGRGCPSKAHAERIADLAACGLFWLETGKGAAPDHVRSLHEQRAQTSRQQKEREDARRAEKEAAIKAAERAKAEKVERAFLPKCMHCGGQPTFGLSRICWSCMSPR